jgi:hypothetical protein
MSTLTVTNIKATGETASRAVSGVAAAWVNFNGAGTVAIRDSENVASITDNGTGDYSVNFSNNMGNTNYSFAVSSGGGTSSYIREAQNGTVATGSFSYLAKYWSAITTANADDALFQNAQFYGDLA